MRKVFIFLFLILTLNLVQGLENSENQTVFLAFGHVYPDHELLDLSVPLIIKENPDFVVFLGDSLTYPNQESWESLKPIINKINKANIPVYFVPGNHDIEGDVQNKKYFEEKISALYYSFDIKNNTFIVLNSENQDISEEQVGFVKSTLNDNNQFIFLHHCLFYKNENEFCNYNKKIQDNNWNNKIIPLIKNKISAVFVGDSGYGEPYFSYEEGGVNYFGVGFSPSMYEIKIPRHMLRVNISEDSSFTVTPIPLKQNLVGLKYPKVNESISTKLKSFVFENVKGVIIFWQITIIILVLIILFLLKKLSKNKT